MLTAALERETSRREAAGPGSRTEADSELHADLIAAVGGLRDPRAAGALADVLDTGGMAWNGLADLGSAAVPAVIREFHSERRRRAVRFALERMLSRGDVTTTALIRAGLLQALNDPNPDVRIAALDSLGHFHDADVTRAVTALANRDPFTTVRDGQRIFPVRLAAVAWLR